MIIYDICNIKVYYLPEIQECKVQFVMIDVRRVKIKAVFISKPFQTPDKKIFDMTWFEMSLL